MTVHRLKFKFELKVCQLSSANCQHLVRVIGLEPTCLAAPDPKSGASANFATPAG